MTQTFGHTFGVPIFSQLPKAYKWLTGSATVDPVFKWLWKNACQIKHKVFFLLMLKDRLNNRNILKGKTWCYNRIPVFSVEDALKRLLITSFCIVPLQEAFGTVLA